MKKKIQLILLLLTAYAVTYAQDQTALRYASQIDSANLYKVISVLASDEYGGRPVGKEGGTMSSSYISELLKASGIPAGNNGSYFQNIEAHNSRGGRKTFLFDKYDYKNDYSYSNYANMDSIITADEIIFVGYGVYSSTYNDFAGLDIKDKVIMKINGTPQNKYGISYVVNNSTEEYMEENRPKAIIEIEKDRFSSYSSYFYGGLVFSQQSSYRRSAYPTISVNELLANKILESTGKTVKEIDFEIEKNGTSPSAVINKPVRLTGNAVYEDANANNVIGFIEGSDLKDEYIIVTAHHDHVGTSYGGQIMNGADDNASGVSALLEIGAKLRKAKKDGKGPRRSVILLFPTAEESGLYGSAYYTENPVYPLNKTVACINLDMLGRVSDKYIGKTSDYVYVVNHTRMSGGLKQYVERVNSSSMNLTLDYTHTSPDDRDSYFERSDQYNFARQNIPSIYFSSGTHEDYHQPTDDTERINISAMWKRTQLAFLTLWELANTDKKFDLESIQKEEEKNKAEEKIQISVVDVKGM